ncbi:MAG: mechanosensitive ion channel family protein [Anaerolineae bacterium]|jgi:small-conductance mechanosensitive channel
MEFLGLTPEQWQEVGIAAAIVAAGALVGWLLRWLLDLFLTRYGDRTRSRFDDVVLHALRTPLAWLILVIAIQIALDRLTFLTGGWRQRREDLIFVLYVVIGYLFLHRLIGSLARWYAVEIATRTESSMDEHVVPFARRVVTILLAVIVVIITLSHFGVDVSALVTTLGIGSLAIALAAQATLADTIAGMAIIADRPFSVGDRIEILELDTWGDVTDIGLRSTRIRTRDNRMVIVPNSVIGQSLVVNHSVPSTVYRVETHVGVAYGIDIGHVRGIMIEAVRAQDWVMQDRLIEALFLEYGDSAMIFRVRCWIEDYVETRRIIDKLNSCLYEALTEAQIELPSPIRTLYHRVDAMDRDGLVAVLREAQQEE